MIFMQGCAHKPESDGEVSFAGKMSFTGKMSSAGKYRDVIVVDLDNDGFLDIVGGSSLPGNVAIYYGDGSGNISLPKFLPVNGDVRSVAAADFNHDGLKDIVFSIQREASGVMVWEAEPGRIWRKGKSPTEAEKYECVTTADINGDGHVDIIAANATSEAKGGIQIWLGNGNGGWPLESGPTVTGRYMGVDVADFDGDGFLDIAGAGWGKFGSLRIWFGNGFGGWTAGSIIDEGSFYRPSAADINDDGHMDIAAGTYRSGVAVYYGDGKGVFAKGKGPVVEGSFWKALPVQINKGKTVDIVAGSIESGGLKGWLQVGTGLWREMKETFPFQGVYYGIDAGDLNNDGFMDICAAGFAEGIKIWMGGEDRKLTSGTDPATVSATDGTGYKKRVEVTENDVFKTISGIPEYRIGPDDVLEITLWKGVTPIKEVITVKPNGKISFGFAEDLVVDGLTASELDKLITDSLKEKVKNPRIDVLVVKFRSKFVAFSGAISSNPSYRSGPGQYVLNGKAGILDMLNKAGGPASNANMRDVRLRRKNGQIISLNLYKAINQGEMVQDIVLDDGDLVFVPFISKEANRVYVFGEVKKPGAYTFTGTSMRIFDAISEAGGFTSFAIADETRIVRGDIAQPEIITAELNKLIEEGDHTQNLALMTGDLVYVPRGFMGDINLLKERIEPLFRLILMPATIVNEYDYARDVIKGN